jgi:hypothetical protein
MCSFLKPLLFEMEPSRVHVRLQAMVALASVAEVAGKDAFGPYLEMGMQSASEDIVTWTPILVEARFLFYVRIVKMIGESFEPYVRMAVVEILTCLMTGLPDDNDEDNDDNDPNETENQGEESNQYVEDPAFRAKINMTAAITALGSIAQHAPRSFFPVMFRCLPDVLRVLVCSGATLLQECVEMLTRVVVGMEQLLDVEAQNMNEEVFTRVCLCLSFIMRVIERSHDEGPVSVAYVCIAMMIRLFGPLLLQLELVGMDEYDQPQSNSFQRIMQNVQLAIEEEAVCQRASREQPANAVTIGNNEEPATSLMKGVLILLETVSRATGPSFAPMFEDVWPAMLKFVNNLQRSAYERACVLAIFAVCITSAGEESVRYGPTILPLASQYLKDENAFLRRSGAYVLGKFAKAVGAGCASYVNNMLQWLYPLCTRPLGNIAVNDADVDDAVTAACLIINACPTLAPLPTMLPIILARLPLRDNTDEAYADIYKCLVGLLASSNPAALIYFSAILSLMGQELLLHKLAPGTQEYLEQALKELAEVPSPELFRNALTAIEDESVRQIITSLGTS